jgi:hypothetical protein
MMCRLELDQHCIFAGELLQNDIIDLEGFAGMLIEFSVANLRSVLSRQTLSCEVIAGMCDDIGTSRLLFSRCQRTAIHEPADWRFGSASE